MIWSVENDAVAGALIKASSKVPVVLSLIEIIGSVSAVSS